jgi:hypothetical protein
MRWSSWTQPSWRPRRDLWRRSSRCAHTPVGLARQRSVHGDCSLPGKLPTTVSIAQARARAPTARTCPTHNSPPRQLAARDPPRSSSALAHAPLLSPSQLPDSSRREAHNALSRFAPAVALSLLDYPLLLLYPKAPALLDASIAAYGALPWSDFVEFNAGKSCVFQADQEELAFLLDQVLTYHMVFGCGCGCGCTVHVPLPIPIPIPISMPAFRMSEPRRSDRKRSQTQFQGATETHKAHKSAEAQAKASRARKRHVS